jgi:hypothetical protein
VTNSDREISRREASSLRGESPPWPRRGFVAFFAVIFLVGILLFDAPLRMLAGAAPQAPQVQPGPGKKLVTTPFGPIEVDISDPRPAIAGRSASATAADDCAGSGPTAGSTAGNHTGTG